MRFFLQKAANKNARPLSRVAEAPSTLRGLFGRKTQVKYKELIQRAVLSVIVACSAIQPHAKGAKTPDLRDNEAGLHLVVIDGEDGINIVKKKTAVQPVVEVRDKNNVPVSGASVMLAAPHGGASAIFANGSRTLTAMTNESGRIAVTSMKPVGTGAFKITVTASFHGQVASGVISQTNYLTVAAAHAAGAAAGSSSASGGSGVAGSSAAAATSSGLSTGAIAGIAGGVAAAAVGTAVGVKAATSSSSSSNQCTSQVQNLVNAASTADNTCLADTTPTGSQCAAAVDNTLLPALSSFCSCANANISGFASELQQLINQYQNALQQAGFTNVTPANVCSLH
jgi:hypothetical protein